MGGLQIRVGRTSGPVFDGRAARAISDFTDELEEEVAEWALRSIQRTFHREFKQPTGFYESNVRISNMGGEAVVHDGGHSGPVYGPWLEGVGSRNATTRFKGYGAFRKAAMQAQRRSEEIGERLLVSGGYLTRMN